MKIYLDLFITGLALGWGPCFAFCAPLLLPYIACTQKGWQRGLSLSLVFSLSRIAGYIILSVISATFGLYIIKRFFQEPGNSIVNLMAGSLILFLGIIISLGKGTFLHVQLPFKKLSGPGIKEILLLGLLVGLAPCLPLVGVLTYIAFNSKNVFGAALLGLSFGLGTIISPLVLLSPLAGQAYACLVKKPKVFHLFSRACGLILVYLGLSMAVRALQTIR